MTNEIYIYIYRKTTACFSITKKVKYSKVAAQIFTIPNRDSNYYQVLKSINTRETTFLFDELLGFKQQK